MVLGADSGQQRAVQPLGEIQRRHRALGCGAGVGCGAVDEASPAVDGGVEAVAGAGEQEGQASAHAEADAPDLAGDVGTSAQLVGGALEVAEDGGVGHREQTPEHRL